MSRWLRWSLAAAGIAAVTLGIGFTVNSQQKPPAGFLQPNDAQVVLAGKSVYATFCAVCHGVNLEGQPDWRVRGSDGLLPAPPHDASGHTWHHADELLFRITKFGNAALVGGDYKSNMPGFGKVLSDADIVAVLSYIKSTWPTEVRERHDAINETASRR